jgi:hypothetical protein
MIMAATKKDLRDFAQFAAERLENGATGTLSDLVSEWEAQRSGITSTVANCAIQIEPETGMTR